MSFSERYLETLDAKGLGRDGAQVASRGGRDYVEIGMQLKNTRVKILAAFDEKSVSVRCFGIAKVPAEKFGDVLMVCNKMNSEYRFVRFLIDQEDEVTIAADAYLEDGTAGEETFALVLQTAQMVDDIYPQIMKAMWT